MEQRMIEYTTYIAAPTGGVKLPIVAATMQTRPNCTGSPPVMSNPNENVFCVHQSMKSLRRQSHFVMMAPCGVAHAEQSFQKWSSRFFENPAKTKEIRAGIRQPAKEMSA
jgi:hypothetical protein